MSTGMVQDQKELLLSYRNGLVSNGPMVQFVQMNGSGPTEMVQGLTEWFHVLGCKERVPLLGLTGFGGLRGW